MASALGYPVTVAPPQRNFTAFPICARFAGAPDYSAQMMDGMLAVAFDVVNLRHQRRQQLAILSIDNKMAAIYTWPRTGV